MKNIWSDRYFSTPALSVSSSPLLPSPLSSDAQKEREKETEQEKQKKQKEKEKTNQHQEEEKEEQKEVEEEMYFASYLKNNTGKYGGREREREENGLWLRVILTLLYSFLSPKGHRIQFAIRHHDSPLSFSSSFPSNSSSSSSAAPHWLEVEKRKREEREKKELTLLCLFVCVCVCVWC